MADDKGTTRRRRAFWTSVPRMLTAIAGLLTAVATLFGVLLAAGVLHPPSPVQTTSRADLPDSSTPSWEGAEKQVTFDFVRWTDAPS